MPRHGNQIFGAADIARHCNQAQKGKAVVSTTSQADQHHDQSREAARRRRQMERKASK